MGNMILKKDGMTLEINNKAGVALERNVIDEIIKFIEMAESMRKKSDNTKKKGQINSLEGVILDPFVMRINYNLDNKIIQIEN
ncbi:MAG: hypothetical protein GY870_10810 [archaeon]|nr:hypothetical protein [archaeon]